MLTADGEQTLPVFEDRGLPLAQTAVHAAGDRSSLGTQYVNTR
jgi:hypothetical protein